MFEALSSKLNGVFDRLRRRGALSEADVSEALREVRVPTLVIHGRDDKLLPAAGGKAVAKAIPGARLELIDGMGHDLPEELWPRFADLIAENAERAAPAPS